MSCHGVSGSFLGVSKRALSFRSFDLAILSRLRACFDGGLVVALFFGFAFALVFFGFFAFGFRPTLFLPAAVFGPGFLDVEALVVRFAVVRPVCAFGRPGDFVVVAVAYVRVAIE